ncbi:MAG TPA: tetratricopeptide repeat protein [Chloroflexi bacterium]|nr:tetratricopeptide repeat protein [Chloroflexota bacterium]
MASPSIHPVASEPLLATKFFVPQMRAAQVARSSLLDQLERGRNCGLMLVSAPAGYGKTTLLAAWVAQRQAPVAWLTLDAADNDPIRFLRYLLAALQRLDATLAQEAQAALQSAAPPPPSTVIAMLINEIAVRSQEHFVLILDDFHLLEDAAVIDVVQMLVAHRPACLHLVIATREDPPLPLARLRAQGELVEVRAHELRFSPAETAQFLQDVMRLSLSTEVIAALDARIEGWPAGLQLAALSLQRQENQAAALADLGGSQHFILNYLTEEVLSQLPAEQQTFLLDTAILPRLSGPLCDALLDRHDSAAQLEALYAANLFITPLDDVHHWWRYHHLFAELLQAQLQHRQPARAAELLRRASAWFAAQGQPAEAIDLACAAQDYAQAVTLVEQHARQQVQQGYVCTVEQWLQRLPAAWRPAGRRANLAFAWSLLLRGRLNEVEPYLLRAEGADAALATDADAAIRAETLALRAALAAVRGDVTTAQKLADDALALAPLTDPYVLGTAHFALGTVHNYADNVGAAIASYRTALPLCQEAGNTVAAMLIVGNLAMLYLARGQLRAAAALCQEVIEAAEFRHEARSPALAVVYGVYSQVRCAWGDWDAARRLSEQALAAARLGGHAAALAYGSVIHARILQAGGDLDGAAASLAQALALRQRGMPAWVEPQIVAQQVMLALARNDEATAQRVLAQYGVALNDPTNHNLEIIHLAWARLLLYQAVQQTAPLPAHLLDAAYEVAGRVLRSATAADRMGVTLEALVLRALIQHAQGDDAGALDDVQQALRLGEAEGYVQLFVEAGAPMHLLLTRLRTTLAAHPAPRDGAPSLAYITQLQQVIQPHTSLLSPKNPQSPNPQSPNLIEPLSDRELDVLRLLAEGLTYQQIADRLIVSVNTVRFHVKSIYGKLGVDRRLAAIDAGRRLGVV